MAQLSITVPDAQVARVRDAFAATYGWTGTDPAGQPETKAQFVLRMIRQHVAAVVKAYEAPAAGEAARKAAAAKVDAEIVLS